MKPNDNFEDRAYIYLFIYNTKFFTTGSKTPFLADWEGVWNLAAVLTIATQPVPTGWDEKYHNQFEPSTGCDVFN